MSGAAAVVAVANVPDGGLQPRVFADGQGRLHSLWYSGSEKGGDLFHAIRGEGGMWSRATRVNSEAGSAIAVGTIRGAQVVLGRDGFIHVVWNGSGAHLAKGAHPPMYYTRSADGGRTFESQRAISGDWPLDGGGAVAADSQGGVHVFWHAGPEMSRAGELSRHVFIRTSRDDGRTFGDERSISPEGLGVCGCCAMQALTTRDGATVQVLFRSAFDEGKSRHIASLASQDGGETFSHAVVDPWIIAACPMSSMSLLEISGGILGAWEREGQVHFALFPKGHPSPSRILSPDGGPGGRKHPVLAADAKGNVLLVWTEGTGWQKGGSLAWEVFDSSLKSSGVRGTSRGVPVWSFAGAAASSEGFVVLK